MFSRQIKNQILDILPYEDDDYVHPFKRFSIDKNKKESRIQTLMFIIVFDSKEKIFEKTEELGTGTINHGKVPDLFLANWTIQCADRYLAVLYDYLHEKMYSYHVLQTNETPVLVNKDGRPARAKSSAIIYSIVETTKNN